MNNRTVTVSDKMQRGYRYQLTERAGRNFDPEFRPQLTPKQMLQLGVFCGRYMTDTRNEFPRNWFGNAKLAINGRDCSLNYFGVDASQPLSAWRKNGWIHPDDPRGWFQWYCRYYMGPPNARGRPSTDQTVEGNATTCSADRTSLPARRHGLPQTPTTSSFTLGLRQPKTLIDAKPGRREAR
jgi:hypothetical protein